MSTNTIRADIGVPTLILAGADDDRTSPGEGCASMVLLHSRITPTES